MVSFSLCLAVSLGFAAQALAVVTRIGSTVILTDTTAKFAGPECITFRNNGEIVEAACVDSAVDRQITPATNSAGAAVLLVERSFGAAQAPSLDCDALTSPVTFVGGQLVAGAACSTGTDSIAQLTVSTTGANCVTYTATSVARTLDNAGTLAPTDAVVAAAPAATTATDKANKTKLKTKTKKPKKVATANVRSLDNAAIHFRSASTQSSAEKREEKSITSRFLPSVLRDAPPSSSLRKIIALAKPERKPLLTAVGLLLVSSGISMSIPIAVGKMIDFFSTMNPQIPLGLSVVQASAIMLIACTAGAVANAGRSYLMKMSGQRIVARLREQTYSAALHQEVEYVEKGEGDVLSRLTVDTSIVGESITQNLSDGLRAVVMSFVGLGAMFYLSPSLTGLMLTVVPPVSLGAFFYGRYLRKLSNQTQAAVGEMSKAATESLSALRTVQAFNAQPQEQAKFHDRVNDILALVKKESIATGVFFGSTGWSGNVTLLALLGYGGSLVSHGEISVGDLTSLLFYTFYVGSGLSMLTSFFASIMRGMGAGTRIFELLDRTPAIPPNKGIAVPSTRTGTVKFENVQFEYPSRKGVEVLKNFELEVGIGESVALVGASGSGKSSVNSLLLRYYDPVKGKVTFDGQDIREFSLDSWRNMIGVVPQDPILFTGTVASNIAFGRPDATREEIERAAREANCEFVWGMPKGFDTEIGRLSLSGGQRQRLAIARALLKQPTILALDEATSSLDATSEHRVNDAIDKILRNRRTTCLVVAHRLSTIARAERIVVLEGGRITETGTYRDLVQKQDSRFRALMAAQLEAAAREQVSLDAPSTPLTEEAPAAL